MRALTTAMRAPLACARRRKFGQNSVSASTTNSGRKRRQIRPDRESEVHRKVEYVLFAKAFAREFLPGVGRGRNQHAMPRKAAPHLLHQSADRRHLAHRNRVHPDDSPSLRARAACRQPRRNASHAFDKSRAVFAVAQNLVEPIRQAHQHPQRQHQTVEKIAQVEPF